VKTLAEIAIDAGLVTKAGAAKAGRLAEERKQPLIAMLVRELGVDEVALIAALRKQTRVPLLDPAQIDVEPDALRVLGSDVSSRLLVLPLRIVAEGATKVLRVAMADPTDTSAILELEQLAQCEIEVTALPLSAVEELVENSYKEISTAVVRRSKLFGDNLFVTTRDQRRALPIDGPAAAGESESSTTVKIQISALVQEPDLDTRFRALCQVLAAKGIVSEAELAEALKKPDGKV
jgi:hypothetical protein